MSKGARHLRQEWGRWWRTEDLTDTHIAHRILNDQYRIWQRIHQRTKAEVHQNIGLLKQQQKQATYMQMQRLQMQKQMRGRGYGYGGYGFGMGGGASPMISYRMMQWSQLQIRIGQEEFQHTEVTPGMLAIGRGQARARRHRAAAGVLLAALLAWASLWWLSALAVFAVTAAAALTTAAMAWTAGRAPVRRRPPVPKLLFVPPVAPAHTELEAEPEPFPIREAGRDPRRARECLALALRKDGAQIADVQVPDQTDWGWRVPVVLAGGTLGDLIRILPRVATTLRVGTNRLLAQSASSEDSAAVTIRILTSDPFAEPLPYPERSPGSCTITGPLSIGLSIEGESTPVVLAGQHVLICADTGGGKTAMVQALAEYVTACRDAVAVDIDPAKRGLKALSPAAVLTARTPADAETLLDDLLARARTRIASLPPTQDTWTPAPDAPAVIVFLDEFPMLSKRGKELAVQLLRVGREAMVTLVICTQDATSDVLSDAIADVPGVRIMLPCRAADVPLVVGQADAISKGWLPHLLVPSPEPDFPADAGRFYCITPRHRAPVLRYVSPLPPGEADRRTRERVAVGLPRLDPAPAVPADAPEIARLLLAAFAAERDPEALTVAQLAGHLAAADPATWGRWEGRSDRRTMIGRHIRSQLRAAGLDVPTVRLDAPGRPTAYRREAILNALHARLS